MSILAPMLRKQQVFAAKAETTTGTPIALAAADGTTVIYDAEIEQDDDFNQRPGQGSLDMHEGIIGAQVANVKFSSELVGSGTAASAPSFESILLASGLGVAVASTRVYTPVTGSSSYTSLTCGHYIDGVFYSAAGVTLDFTLKGDSGKQVMFDWTGKGRWIDPSAVALITPTYVISPIPPRLVSATFTIGGTQYISRSFEFAMQNTIAVRRDGGSAGGVHSTVITGRNPTWSMDVEASTSKLWHTDYTAGTTAALSIAIGSVAGNIWTGAAPKVQLMAPPSKIDIEGVLGYRLKFGVVRNSSAGDDAFSWTHS